MCEPIDMDISSRAPKKKANLASLKHHQKSSTSNSGSVRGTTLSLHKLLPEDEARLRNLKEERLQEKNRVLWVDAFEQIDDMVNFLQNVVHSRYETVDFVKNTSHHKNTCAWGQKVWGVFSVFKVCSVFYLSHCNAVYLGTSFFKHHSISIFVSYSHEMLSTPSVGSLNLVKHIVKKEVTEKGNLGFIPLHAGVPFTDMV